MKPMWKEIEGLLPELVTEYFDADEHPEKMEEYGIKDIPVFIFLDKDGKEFLRLRGVQNKDFLLETVKKNLER
jgi:thiol-disulfide isomerase/thioredoxin